jgi:UDP-N-acetylmuramyl pentapeptide phosphotransferase/UDP-N-acetylglucosamine-1-phosphate transferase
MGAASRRGWGRLTVPNHRGVPVPRSLGLVIVGGAVVGTAVAAATGEGGGLAWGALAAVLLVAAAGLVDDLVGAGPRGLREHLRALTAGTVTTGLVKVVVITGAAVVAVSLLPARSPGERLAGAVLLAASANVGNGLDVRPGRALKAFLVGVAIVLAYGAGDRLPLLPGIAVAAVVALPLDLRERGMLGDGGANVLGFALGLGVVEVGSGIAVLIGAVVAVGLNVVADTVSFSRVIEAFPPLRWFDALGRKA